LLTTVIGDYLDGDEPLGVFKFLYKSRGMFIQALRARAAAILTSVPAALQRARLIKRTMADVPRNQREEFALLGMQVHEVSLSDSGGIAATRY
jgi:hypothetical protein